MKYVVMLSNILFLLLSACGPDKPERPDFGAYEGIVTEIEAYAQQNGVELDLSALEITDGTFADPQKRATCEHSSSNQRITVSTSHWDNMPHAIRLWVMTHEIGHCIALLYHDGEIKDDGAPVSIMYPFLFNNPDYVSLHINTYMNQIWSNVP